ncbi:Conserved hypothetical protein [Clostridium kluyveri DSM 555]|uniref:Uncharacterized protein n=1 Tax=Clostridium kluyveri (strain ATCC 8527 / DSM 555 / NBRC 12016 / NCIMB 10680 / K1) TaxID=431943 RepID=A5N5Q3_CLOK5|nr:Conserved hypothetical protein [Clostridium kluyveri DSM 555]
MAGLLRSKQDSIFLSNSSFSKLKAKNLLTTFISLTYDIKVEFQEGFIMSLNHVILGLLNGEPLTGYEIKKIIQNTPFMYWSENNNQIYKAFVELLDEGFVTKKVQHQDECFFMIILF